MLSLREALRSGRLQEFIRQEEARGVGKGALRRMDRALARTLGRPRSADPSAPSQSRKRKPGNLVYSDVSILTFIAGLL